MKTFHMTTTKKKLLPATLAVAMLFTSSAAVFGAEQDLAATEKRTPGIHNPIVNEKAGDPCILKDGEDYYMSATGGTPEDFTGFVVWHSTDLFNWSEPAKALDFKDISWAEGGAWAPSMVEKDGYYYLSFVADKQIGLAVSDNPMGPYKDALGKPLISKEDFDFQTIDPAFFKDDDGKIYFAFGQSKCLMNEIELTPNSATFVNEEWYDWTTEMCWQITKPTTIEDNILPKGYMESTMGEDYKYTMWYEDKAWYNEAPDIFKVGDRYLLTWACYDVNDYRYGIRYAWSNVSPIRGYQMPFSYDFPDNFLLQGNHGIVGAGHGAITEKDGTLYVVYGRRDANGSRELCIEPIQFLDKNHIQATASASASVIY